MKITIANWKKHQHYKHRRPPWIKLYTDIIEEYDVEGTPKKFRAMPDDAKLTFLMLLTLASHYDGTVPNGESRWIAEHTGIDEKRVLLAPLQEAGYIITEGCASVVASVVASNIATVIVPQSKRESTETETDGEGMQGGQELKPPTSKPRRKPATIEETLTVLKAKFAPLGIDVDRERQKCEAWCMARNIQTLSLQRFVNWLNRSDKTIPRGQPANQHKGIQEHIEGKML